MPLDPREGPVGHRYIWPDMYDSLAVFMALGTQWNWISAGMAGAHRQGLKYESITPTAEAAGIAVTPKLFDDIRTLEGASLGYWARRR